MSLCPLAATQLRCIGQPLEINRNGVPSAREDLKLFVSVPSPLQAHTSANVGLNLSCGIRAQSRSRLNKSTTAGKEQFLRAAKS